MVFGNFLLTKATMSVTIYLESGVNKMTIGDRIKKARKTLDLTQTEFATRIKSTQNSVTRYETGDRSPSPAVVGLICREFNINENWLRTGEGEMFEPSTQSIFDKFAKELGLEPRDRILIEKFLDLPPEGRQAVMDYALSVAKAVQGDVVTQSPPTYQDGDEEDYADIARRQRLSEKEQAAQVSSAKELGVG